MDEVLPLEEWHKRGPSSAATTGSVGGILAERASKWAWGRGKGEGV